MQQSLHPAVEQLAGAIVSDPAKGIQLYEEIRQKVPTISPIDQRSRAAIDAIRTLGTPPDQAALCSEVMKRLPNAREPEKLGYQMVLGALWDDLAVRDRRGALQDKDRSVQRKLRVFFHPGKGYASS